MSNNDAGVRYLNRIDGTISIGAIPRNSNVFTAGERVEVQFNNGERAREFVASLFRDGSNTCINLAPGAILIRANGIVETTGWTIGTRVAKRIDRD